MVDNIIYVVVDIIFYVQDVYVYREIEFFLLVSYFQHYLLHLCTENKSSTNKYQLTNFYWVNKPMPA